MIDKLVNLFDNFLSKNLSKVKTLNRLIAFICLVFLFQFFNQERINFGWDIKYLIAILLIFVGYIFQSLSWSYIISEKLDFKILSSWLISIIGKYLPLKIGIPVLRITDDLNTKKPNSKKYLFGVLVEVLLQVLAGILFTGLFIISKLFSINYFICLFLYLLVLLGYFLIYKNKYFFIVIMNSISYIFFLFSITLTGLILYEEVIIELGLAYIFSSVISLIFVGSPAGLGVREYFFILLFQNNSAFSSINFIEFLVYIRLVFVLTDLFSYIVGRMTKALNN